MKTEKELKEITLASKKRLKDYLDSLNKWEPIETAPMDGTHVLLFTKGYKKRWIGWFYNNAWHWDGVYQGIFPHQPTHWMLIPDGPDDK